MDQLRDMYEVVGVAPDADALHIRRVYREKVRALRIDSSRDHEAEARLRELTHAYAVLSNPHSRSLYDRLALQTGSAKRPNAGAPIRESTDLGDEELRVWVFGDERPQEVRPDGGTPSHAVDLLARYFAPVGFVIAVLFLVLVVLRG
jgi:curved DNA-binding protein CbpA